ncbi:DUF2807 domain-containing protein [Flavobacterium sp. DG1-102-2]|uniref:GIN domain-containing protein n=1 Tax=Flavobacterium sp. DG1-102-2 TaxID=3081663 RepID=UPI002948F28E|nr:DUF2807 domain-containing protein [Flavobacterium sp. DG1-102-2]MDV6169848.1 DUF2807 domain-containing protein [Flavobacterium sp. DG1-102-2]
MKQLAITALILLSGSGAKAQKSETRQSSAFNALEVKNGIEVVFTQGNDTSIKVESDSRDNLNEIATEVKNGTLKIYLREPVNNKPMQGTAKVFVTAENVASFKAEGGALIKVDGKLTVNELTIKLASGAAFSGEAACKEKCTVRASSGGVMRGIIKTEIFDTKITSGASVKITGHATASTVICNSGTFLAGRFISKNADVKATNASAAFVNSEESIIANTDNSSSITYYGEPQKVNLGENSYAVKRDNLKLALNN